MQEKKETKTTATPAVKAEVKETAKTTTAATKTEVKEAAKPAAKKPAAKKTTKKAATKKTEPEVKMIVQYQSNESEIATVQEKVKNQFAAEGHRIGSIKTLEIYMKPEEYSAYYVINDKFSGRVDLF